MNDYNPNPIDDGLAIILYILSFFVFLVGIIGGIILLTNPLDRNREIGRNMIIIALVGPLLAILVCCLGGTVTAPILLKL